MIRCDLVALVQARDPIIKRLNYMITFNLYVKMTDVEVYLLCSTAACSGQAPQMSCSRLSYLKLDS